MQNFKDQEEKIINWWEQEKIFEQSVERQAPKGDYLFYDGPPFATGVPHYGHLVASIMKDVVPRYWTMNGYRVERRWGWDCHGLPIENIVEKELGSKKKKEIEAMGVDKFNELCRSKVLEYVDIWEKVIPRIGRWVDMKHAYKTMDIEFMESVWWVFKQLWDKGLVYQAYRSMHICPRCETTLSQSEVTEGYRDIKDLSLTAKFELIEESAFAKASAGHAKTYVLAWTTTPWTLIGNVALAVGKNIEYSLVKAGEENYILASDLVASIFKEKEIKVIEKFKGSELVGKIYKPLFDYYAGDKDLENNQNGWKIYAADFVSTEEGTGVVHIAPAFGEDDMNLGKAEKLPFIQHVSMDGTIKPEAGEFAGLNVKPKDDVQATDVEIIKYLAGKGLLFSKEKYEHSYPHCWRCDTPLLNYATSSYFVAVTKIKDEALSLAKEINWSPEHIKEGRFGKWLEGARDWSISRQRFWASVMPIWVCECGEQKVIGSVEELESLSKQKVTDLHKHVVDKITFPCPKCQMTMKRIPDVLDTWFDSGSMPYAQMHYPFENKAKFENSFPAEFIAEGSDQARAWFYYLHIIATAITNKPAYKNVIVNGIVAGEDGKKMSKRLKNFPDPMAMVAKYGADTLRLYLLNSPVMLAENLSFVEKDLETTYRRFIALLQNVFNFYEMFKVPEYKITGDELPKLNNDLDKWIVAKFYLLNKEVTEAMESYNLVKATRPLLDFVDELSTWYLRRSRERFKSSDQADKQMALQTLSFILKQLSKVIAPFTPMTAEMIFQEFSPDKSVHLEPWLETKDSLIDQEVLTKMDTVKNITEAVHAWRAQAGLKVRQPLATLELPVKTKLADQDNFVKILADEVNVEQVRVVDKPSVMAGWQVIEVNDFKVSIDANMTEDLKDKGTVRELIRMINSLRKEAGLQPIDRPIETYQTNSTYLLAVIDKYKDEIIQGTSAGSLEQVAGSQTDSKVCQINKEEITLGLKK